MLVRRWNRVRVMEDRRDRRDARERRTSARPCTLLRGAVRKVCQKCTELLGKGFCFERKQMSPSSCEPMEEKEISRKGVKRADCWQS